MQGPRRGQKDADVKKPLVYMAGALHTAGQRQHLELIAALVEGDWDVFLPHRDGGMYWKMLQDGDTPAAASARVYEADVAAIRRSDALLVVSYGRFISDAGVCLEIGYARAIGLQCVAYAPDLDDSRAYNPMLRASVAQVMRSIGALRDYFTIANRTEPRT